AETERAPGQLQPPPRHQQADLPEDDRAGHQLVVLKRLIHHAGGAFSQSRGSLQHPDQHVRVEDDHFLFPPPRAFQRSSSGLMISPRISISSFIAPTRRRGLFTIGTTRATGLPRLVITTFRPVSATRSRRSRHVALNSAALIV